eukprot:scaffold6760_cov119-Isochrysis_galbana.AAC.6
MGEGAEAEGKTSCGSIGFLVGPCWRMCFQNSAGAWRVTMAPRQLRLEPIEADTAADKGDYRVDAQTSTNLICK